MTPWENLPSSSEVEHLTVNQNVAGSIPAWAANRCLAQKGEHLFYTQKVIGSIPITPTKHGEAVQVVSSTDCKSAVQRLCWFNSSPSHQLILKKGNNESDNVWNLKMFMV